MAQSFSINEAQTLISNLLDSVWETEGKKAVKPAYEKIFNVKNMDRGEFVDYRIAGLGKFTERGELEDVTYDQLEFGETQTTLPKNWGSGFRISEEVVEDLADAGPNDGIIRSKLGSYADVVRRWRRSATWTVEVECANRLLNGTSTAAAYVGRDALALFSASHVTLKNPTTTQSNLATHASLSPTSLASMRRTLDTQLDDRGDYLPDNEGFLLVVSPLNDDRAYEILNTRGQVDSANNNVNTLNQYKMEVVVNKYLGTTFAGYYLLAKGVHTLNWYWRKKPEFKQDTDFDAVAMKYRGRFRGVSNFTSYIGAVGDNGS